MRIQCLKKIDKKNNERHSLTKTILILRVSRRQANILRIFLSVKFNVIHMTQIDTIRIQK